MDYYLGEIRIFPFSTMPSDWMPCNGQSLPIQTNQALYSLLGTNFGGNATNFNLPNLNGTVIVGTGIAAKSGTCYVLGNYNVPTNQTGMESVLLTPTNLPAHTHYVNANESYTSYLPEVYLGNPNIKGVSPQIVNASTANIYGGYTNTITLPADTISSTGDGAGHENRQPFMPLVYCIATANGLYPPRP